jgi:hypothetical protein
MSLQEIYYCYQCFTCVLGHENWESHCADYTTSMTSKRCGLITYLHTLLRPAYSPFRLGQGQSAARKLKSWTRDCTMWERDISVHLSVCQWPMLCPHPLCDSVTLEDEKSLYYYLMDEHKVKGSCLFEDYSDGGNPCTGVSLGVARQNRAISRNTLQ